MAEVSAGSYCQLGLAPAWALGARWRQHRCATRKYREPGGICLSEDAYRHMRGKISEASSDLGVTRPNKRFFSIPVLPAVLSGFVSGFELAQRS